MKVTSAFLVTLLISSEICKKKKASFRLGWLLHYKHDGSPLILNHSLFCLAGENVLAIILQLASSSKLTNPGEERHGSMVYFDFLGYFMVAYPQRMGQILNWATVLFVYLSFIKRLSKERGISFIKMHNDKKARFFTGYRDPLDP